MTTLENILAPAKIGSKSLELPWVLLAVLACAFVLITPAIWNGYPLLYWDSVDYVMMPYTWDMPIYRTGGYGVFALSARAVNSVWGIVLAQSLITAYVLYETFHLFVPAARLRAMFATTLFLTVVTGLPWAMSKIMPDALTGALVLAILVVAFEDGALSRARRWALITIIGIAGAVHTTHLGILGGLLICLALMVWMARKGWPVLRPRVIPVAVSFALALGFAAGSNWAMTGRVFVTQPNQVLTLGLLVQDGLAKRYLAEICTQQGVSKPRLCMIRNRLPDNANQFIWHDPDFWRLGGWNGLKADATKIIKGCLTKYPFHFAWTSVVLTFQQLVMVEAGDGVSPMHFFISQAIKTYYPKEMPAFIQARQQAGIDFTIINTVGVPIVLTSFIALVMIGAYGWKKRDKLSVTLTSLTMLALLGNAFLCGAMSNPNDRYGARIGWVALLVVMILIPRLIQLMQRPDQSAVDQAAGTARNNIRD